MGTAIFLRSVIVLAGLCVLLCIPLFLAADGGNGAGAAIAVIQLLALIVGFGGGVLLLFVRPRRERQSIAGSNRSGRLRVMAGGGGVSVSDIHVSGRGVRRRQERG